MITKVELSARAKKDLRGLPQHVVGALRRWVDAVEHEGLEAVRRVPGYHDEPLGGDRKGQRSIRAEPGVSRVLRDQERRGRGCGSDRSERARLLNDADEEKQHGNTEEERGAKVFGQAQQ